MNKRGWIRIVEAFIAILMIIGAILFIYVGQDQVPDISEDVHEKQSQILEVIVKNESLREDIIHDYNGRVDNIISNMIASNWDFATKICDVDDLCNLDITPNDRDVYVAERLVTSSLTEYSPKKIRFFVWAA